MTDSAGGLFPQLPIQGTSALGLLAFALIDRNITPKLRPYFTAALTLVGIGTLMGITTSSNSECLMALGALSFFLLGLVGGAAYWSASVHLRFSKRFATYIGGSHALGVIAQIPFFGMVPNQEAEVALLVLAILALGHSCHQEWPSPEETQRTAQLRTASGKQKIVPAPQIGWKLEHLSPTKAMTLLVCLILMLSVLFNTLYGLTENDGVWTSQYTDVMSRITLAIGGLGAGLLFDIKRGRFAGITMLWVALLSIAAIFGLEAGVPEIIGDTTFFLGSGAFVTFYTATFVWISPYMRIPALWAGMGRVISNLSSLALAAPLAFFAQTSSTLSIVTLMLPLLIGINAVLFELGLLDLHIGASDENARTFTRKAASGARESVLEIPLVREGAASLKARVENNRQSHGLNSTELDILACALKEAKDGDMPSPEDFAAKQEARLSLAAETPLQEDGAAADPKQGSNNSEREQAEGPSPEERLAAFGKTYGLTPRECKVVAAVTADDALLKNIAEDMGISLRTLQRHLTSIYKKTDSQSRVGLTKLFWE